jgi:hypothetical protein
MIMAARVEPKAAHASCQLPEHQPHLLATPHTNAECSKQRRQQQSGQQSGQQQQSAQQQQLIGLLQGFNPGSCCSAGQQQQWLRLCWACCW